MSKVGICRLCLTIGITHNIESTDLQEVYEKLTNIPFQSKDNKPKTTCNICFFMLKKCQKLKELALRADRVLTGLILLGTELTPLSIGALDKQKYNLTHGLGFSPPELIQFKTCINDESDQNTTEIHKSDNGTVHASLNVKEENTEKTDQHNIDSSLSEPEDAEALPPTDNLTYKVESDSEDDLPLKNIRQTNKSAEKYPVHKSKRIDTRKESSVDQRVFKGDYAKEIILSKKQQLDALKERSNSLNYQNSPYKCELCYKGFLNVKAYENHREKHDKKSGEFDCEICHMRYQTDRQLRNHAITSHKRQYACNECGHRSHTASCKAPSWSESLSPIPIRRRSSSPSTDESLASNRKSPVKKRIRKRDYCLYCKSKVLNFSRHLKRSHILQPEVRKIYSHSKKSVERKRLLAALRKKWNFVINSGEKVIKPVRFSSVDGTYRPCIHCLGFYNRKTLWKHRRLCIQNPKNNDSIQIESQNIWDLEIYSQLISKVFSKMKPDSISLIAKNDPLIRAFGARCLNENDGKNISTAVSRKMRYLAKLVMKLKSGGTEQKTLIDFLRPEQADRIKTTLKILWPNGEQARSVVSYLGHCVDIAVLSAKDKDDELLSIPEESIMELKTFLKLLYKSRGSIELENLSIGRRNDEFYDSKELETPKSNPYQQLLDNFRKELSSLDENDTQKDLSSETQQQPRKRALKTRKLVPWTEEQKRRAIDFFTNNIKLKIPPKKGQCQDLLTKYPKLYQNKDWLKLKVFIQNIYTKKYK